MNIVRLTTSLTAILLLAVQSPVAGSPVKTYKGAITAKELLVLTGACNMLGVPDSSSESQAVLSAMCRQGIALLKLGTVFDEYPRWLWEPGTMTNHPDFIYAGNPEIRPDLRVAPIEGISLDSSHFFAKWPLFFLAARDSGLPDENGFIHAALSGITENLFSRVIDGEPPDGSCVIRYRTYTDGTNGVFRWNWQQKGVHYGSGAYQLSIAPFYSSLALLDDQRISQHYQDLLECFPYSSDVREKYFHGRSLDPYKLLIELSQTRPSRIGRDGPFPTAGQTELYERYLRPRLLGTDEVIADDEYEAVVGIRMLVMHYAFVGRYNPWIQDFFNYADKASSLICHDCDRFESLYYELHLVHFLTRFLRVAAANGYATNPLYKDIQSRTEARLLDLYSHPQREVVSTPGWNDVTFYTFREYADWKLRYHARTPESPKLSIQ